MTLELKNKFLEIMETKQTLPAGKTKWLHKK